MVERIMFKMPEEFLGTEKMLQQAKDEISKFLKEYTAAHPEYKYTIDDITIRQATESMIKTKWATGRGMLMLDLYKDGTGKVVVKNFTGLEWATGITGAFSTQNQDGTLDVQQARNWLETKLGIP